MTSYEEILESAKRLSSVERLQLADALLAEELGFGMWQARKDVADAEAYVCRICVRQRCGHLTAERRLLKSFLIR